MVTAARSRRGRMVRPFTKNGCLQSNRSGGDQFQKSKPAKAATENDPGSGQYSGKRTGGPAIESMRH